MKHLIGYFIFFICAAAVGTAAALILYTLHEGTVLRISNNAGLNRASFAKIDISPTATSTPISVVSPSSVSYCDDQTVFADGKGKEVCLHKPKSFAKKSIEVDLTKMRLYYYEDFFIHGIPKYEDGSDVPLGFSGGCLRLSDVDAKNLFSRVDIGTQVYVYDNDLAVLQSKGTLIPPVDLAKVWIRQSFNNPHYAPDRRGENDKYVNHTGVDLAPDFNVQDFLAVNAISDGKIVLLQKNGEEDHGFGNVIILEHTLWIANNDIVNSSSSPRLLENKRVYSLYAHLDSFTKEFMIGDKVQKGEILGIMGASGYGCQTFWRIGQDGCENKNPPDTHLHFEIKTAPVLTNPQGGEACIYLKNAIETMGPCFGDTPNVPTRYGYLDPLIFLKENQ